MRGKGENSKTYKKWVDSDRVTTPRHFKLLHKSVTLVADVLFVNGIPFFITISRKICFVDVEHMQSRTANQPSRYLNKALSLYARASYNVEVLFMDMGFDPVSTNMSNVTVNMTAAHEHVGDIDIELRAVTERGQATLNTLPFRELPK